MELGLSSLYCAIGLFMLFWCGNKLVDGAVVLARSLNVSTLFIGVAVIGFGTSLPEILSTVSAARLDKPDIVLGNIIGSNVANIGLVLGLALFMSKAFKPTKPQMQEYILMMLALWLFTLVLLVEGVINVTTAIGLTLGLVMYLVVSLQSGKKNIDAEIDEGHSDLPKSTFHAVILIAIGLVGLFFGADLVIKGAVDIANGLGISERIIGLTLVAVGTSLPEMAAAIAAARHGKIGMTLGNVAGSNVFNALAASGAAGFVTPIVSSDAIKHDLLIMIGFGFIMGYLFLVPKPSTKQLGILMIALYAVYIINLAIDSAV